MTHQQIGIALLTLLSFLGISHGDLLAKDDPLEPLNLCVGTWDAEVTLKKAAWTPLEIKSKGENTVQWILSDKFIESKYNFAPFDSESLELVNYDSEAGVYRSWNFSPTSFPSGETTGNWDTETRTLNWTADYGSGFRGKGNWKFIGDDKKDWAFTVTDPTGKVLLDMQGTNTRKK